MNCFETWKIVIWKLEISKFLHSVLSQINGMEPLEIGFRANPCPNHRKWWSEMTISGGLGCTDLRWVVQRKRATRMSKMTCCLVVEQKETNDTSFFKAKNFKKKKNQNFF